MLSLNWSPQVRDREHIIIMTTVIMKKYLTIVMLFMVRDVGAAAIQ